MDVTITDHVGIYSIKTVGPGDSVTSLLSFLDVLTGHPAPFKTVQARAEVDSVILKLPAEAFLPIFDKRPGLLVQIVQIMMARVQRVFFVALHRHLGVSSELVKPESECVDQHSLTSLCLELDAAVQGTPEMLLEAGVKGLQVAFTMHNYSSLVR